MNNNNFIAIANGTTRTIAKYNKHNKVQHERTRLHKMVALYG